MLRSDRSFKDKMSTAFFFNLAYPAYIRHSHVNVFSPLTCQKSEIISLSGYYLLRFSTKCIGKKMHIV